ncbi:hypothetical protein TPHA_0I00990 [Tetrapisispora phaffii CBS 4417]|uniref:Arrestin C-terminal-like domain-containing protein n=1 Tax=Tetrapisispora phaffii (strain ATCC 24235 / CBS 4417 / NBRC 1672 / NRRL Y-8282 / UCD 70-5) TaxID=1071381 RepID=G8BXH7_TETPH|nr:hypothetical protein TPHA_0I00990 [Tetrapisispora phaffii CBS 4417]CCE64605.1 hypothetical protein TPHA_0I00990 [Tetrapisispora phaffii CBS 4417]
MLQPNSILSPVFPVEKDVDVSTEEIPLIQTVNVHVFIQLAEPAVFIQGFSSQEIQQRPPSLLRGSLIVRVLKPSKLKSITLNFKGYARTDWPEGIPPKRQEFVEINDIVNHTWPFYHAHSSSNNNRPHEHINLNPRSPRNSIIALQDMDNSLDELEDPIIQESGASVFRSLPTDVNVGELSHNPSLLSVNNAKQRTLKSEGSFSTTHSTPPTRSDSNNKIHKSMSPFGFFKRDSSTVSATTELNSSGANNSNSNINTKNNRSSIFSDLLTNTFSTLSDASPSANANAVNSSAMNKSFSSSNINTNNTSSTITNNDSFTFQPGDYIYTFEQAIPCSYPESIKADFGLVEYTLTATIERHGAFKSNVIAKLPVNILRTPSDTSIEETEPIAISKNWENHLHYDIMIASKDVILDAFLPISFSFSPLDKVTLHRIRIYLTETMEYYCKGKKVHRVEPVKKYLLAEHNGPILKPLQPGEKSTKAKYLGNLLIDEKTGDVMNKDYSFEVFIPSVFSNKQKLHPDTACDKIKASHWIKLSLRLSKITDGKRKHYEIVIDSPIHVLNRLCAHANTLLPCYDPHPLNMHLEDSSLDMFASENGTTDGQNNKGFSNPNVVDPPSVHESNIFFPKEILLSPMLSPDVQTELHKTNHESVASALSSAHDSISVIPNEVFNTPKLKSNIYQPDSLSRELTFAQAVPLSPINSPILQSSALSDDDIEPPTFDFDAMSLNSSKFDNNGLPLNPPSYSKVDTANIHGSEGWFANGSNNGNLLTANNRISTLRLDQKPLSRSGSLLGVHKSNKVFKDIDEDDADGDITSTFTSRSSTSALKLNQNSLSLNPKLWRTKQNGLQDNLPSTIRHANSSFNDLNNIFASDNETDETEVDDLSDEEISKTSSVINESVDDSNIEGASRLPLLNGNDSTADMVGDESFFASADLSEELIRTQPINTLDFFIQNHNSHMVPNPIFGEQEKSRGVPHDYSLQVANANHVLDDFKSTIHDSNKDETPLS